MLVAVAADEDDRRQILAIELANRERRSSWRGFLSGARGLPGVEFVVSDDHPGLKQAIREVLPEAAWQPLLCGLSGTPLVYVPRKVDDDCLQELRRFYDRRDLAEVGRDIAQWLAKWQTKYPKLCNWVEDNIEETLTYYPPPLQHHRREPGLGGCDEILAHVLVVQDIDHNIGHDGRKQGAEFYMMRSTIRGVIAHYYYYYYTNYGILITAVRPATNLRGGWDKKANGVTT